MKRRSRPSFYLTIATGLAGLTALAPHDLLSQDYDMDCKVILCMAGGFPDGCEDAHTYMIKRITAKPPKPPFGQCSYQDGSGDEAVYSGAEAGFGTREVSRTCVSRRSPETGGGCLRYHVVTQPFMHLTIPDDGSATGFRRFETNYGNPRTHDYWVGSQGK